MKGRHKRGLLMALSLVMLLLGLASYSLANSTGEGYSELFRHKCLTCHSINDQRQVSRVDYMRKSPEGWENTIKRMARIWGVNLTRDEIKELVLELSSKRGLAPEESSPVLFLLAQQKSLLEDLPDNEAVVAGCAGPCHTFAKIAGQRRTADEWRKLKDFHLATNPGINLQMRSMDWPAVADEAINYLIQRFPLETAEYQAWQQASGNYQLAGEWAMVGSAPGKGNYRGKLTLTRVDDHNYQVTRQVTYPSGESETWTGNGILFDGYSLRASLANGAEKYQLVALLADQVGVAEGSWRHVSDSGIKGEETYSRLGQEAQLLGASKAGLLAGTEESLQLWGVNLPAGLTAADLAVDGSGLELVAVEQNSSETVTLKVKVAPKLAAGLVKISVLGVAGTVTVPVGQPEYMVVEPRFGVARLGGLVFEKQGVQFEAIAYATASDGTEISLGPVKADWSLQPGEELPFEDDVLKWVGILDENGYFTPALDGPNPERPFSANNVGALIVTATYSPPGTDQLLTASAQLLVSVPDYREIDG